MKGVMRFGKYGKLSPRYVGPFLVTKVVGYILLTKSLPCKCATVTGIP